MGLCHRHPSNGPRQPTDLWSDVSRLSVGTSIPSSRSMGLALLQCSSDSSPPHHRLTSAYPRHYPRFGFCSIGIFISRPRSPRRCPEDRLEKGWTKQMKRGTIAAPHPLITPTRCHPMLTNPLGTGVSSSRSCRSLGGAHHAHPRYRPPAMMTGGQDAGVWQPGPNRLCGVPLPALRPGKPVCP